MAIFYVALIARMNTQRIIIMGSPERSKRARAGVHVRVLEGSYFWRPIKLG